jgi:hypothetical protein
VVDSNVAELSLSQHTQTKFLNSIRTVEVLRLSEREGLKVCTRPAEYGDGGGPGDIQRVMALSPSHRSTQSISPNNLQTPSAQPKQRRMTSPASLNLVCNPYVSTIYLAAEKYN